MKRLKKGFLVCTLAIFLFYSGANASGLWGLDHRVPKDTGGIWHYHVDMPIYLGAAVLGGALWEGADNRFGKTLWQSVDAVIIAEAGTEVLKRATGRVRPSETDNPNLWFQGTDKHSFPAGHVASTAALITPALLEYRKDQPWVYVLAALPAYEMVARVKAQEHWQTDVVAGAAIGAVSGYYTHQLKTPLLIRILPNGFSVGLKVLF